MKYGKLKCIVLIAIVFLASGFNLFGTNGDTELVGTWRIETSDSWEEITYREDGTFTAKGYDTTIGEYSISGTYKKTDTQILMDNDGGGVSEFKYTLKEDELILTMMGDSRTYHRK